jgi:hypothetical protein
MDVPNFNNEREAPPANGMPAKFAYGDEFARRQHRGLRVYVIGIGLFLLIIAPTFLAFKDHDTPITMWLVPVSVGAIVLRLFLAWVKGSPLCPCCKKNIKVCAVDYCYGCGEAMSQGRCERCGVDLSMDILFRPLGATSGNKRAITYCPGCGVWLNSTFRRRGKSPLV